MRGRVAGSERGFRWSLAIQRGEKPAMIRSARRSRPSIHPLTWTVAGGVALLIAGCGPLQSTRTTAPTYGGDAATPSSGSSHADTYVYGEPTGSAASPSDLGVITTSSHRTDMTVSTTTPAHTTPAHHKSTLPTPSSDPFAFNVKASSMGGSPSGSTPEAYMTPADMRSIGLYGDLPERLHDPDSLDGFTNTRQVTESAVGWDWDPEVDRTGEWLVFSSTMHKTAPELYLKKVNGRTVTQLTSDPAQDVMPTFSPDSRRIAFCSNRDGDFDIYIMSIDGAKVVQVTNDEDHEMHPSWSPDGKRLAYCKLGLQTRRWEMWVIDLENFTRHFLDYGLFPQWCPDPSTSKLVFQRGREAGSRYYSIWTIDVLENEAINPTEIVTAANAAVMNPSWSPTGDRIVFSTVVETADKPNFADLWAINVDGTGRTNLTNGRFANFLPTWGADGRIYFVSNRSGVDNIWAIEPSRVLDLSGPQGRGLASQPAPDAPAMATVTEDPSGPDGP